MKGVTMATVISGREHAKIYRLALRYLGGKYKQMLTRFGKAAAINTWCSIPSRKYSLVTTTL